MCRAPAPPPPSASRRRKENFPIASFILAPPQRAAILAFYALARQADDIADDSGVSPCDKLRRLDRFQAELEASSDSGSSDSGVAYLQSLLQAFRQDAVQTAYADWPALLAYCRHSAAPVGRYVLDLHRQPASAQAPADALCIALQILNHVQDCATDWRRLGRCYLPESDLLAEKARVGDLAGARLTPALRCVLDRLLDRCELLLTQASLLPERIADWRLRLEAAIILALAKALAVRLRQGDPLSARIALSPLQAAFAVSRAIAGAGVATLRRWAPPSPKSSFAAAMARVAPERRQAMAALYRFCREIDDIADGVAAPEDKLAALEGWRQRILAGGAPAGLAAYRLPPSDLLAVIDGMAMDVGDEPAAPSLAWLDLYCERVASAVGRLSIRVFGSERPDDLAVATPLGRALQLVNILRDRREDAARVRLYLPAELLCDAGIYDRDPVLALRHPAIARVCAAVASLARGYFAEADRLFSLADRKCLHPAWMMRNRYFILLQRLEAKNWSLQR